MRCSPEIVGAEVESAKLKGESGREEEAVQRRAIITVLNKAEAGAKGLDLCRKHGISDATFYNWKAKYAAAAAPEGALIFAFSSTFPIAREVKSAA